jgi:8-oxo-dGTP diphosphatase
MPVLVVRHADAGDRSRWPGPDEFRPLTRGGFEQSQALVATLAEFPIRRVLSSPYLRCLQTVTPLAEARGLPVEPTPALAEGSSHAARELLASGGDLVLCTHGDVLSELLQGLDPRDIPMEKGGTWVMTVQEEAVTSARYLPPPPS